jgi:uncharacterized damage-inducible protein DinB
MINKKDTVAAEYYHRYLDLVKEEKLLEALDKNTRRFKKFLDKIPNRKADFSYAEGKWTLKELLQHIIDTERVFAYRALSFARRDPNSLPSFDEKIWAQQAPASSRKWKDLLAEWKAQRKSTQLMFASFHDEQLLAVGTANGNPVNPLALGFLCCGHVTHHINVIKQKYLTRG